VHASDVAKRVRVAVKWSSFADYRCGSLSRAICTGLGRSNVCGHCFRLQQQRALGLYRPCPRQASFVGPGVSLGNAVCVMLLGDLADAGHAHRHCSAVLLVCPSALRLLCGRGRDSHLLRRTPTAHSSVRCAFCPGQLRCTAVVELPATGCLSPMSISPQGWTS
jgi:hypothetical protein